MLCGLFGTFKKQKTIQFFFIVFSKNQLLVWLISSFIFNFIDFSSSFCYFFSSACFRNSNSSSFSSSPGWKLGLLISDLSSFLIHMFHPIHFPVSTDMLHSIIW